MRRSRVEDLAAAPRAFEVLTCNEVLDLGIADRFADPLGSLGLGTAQEDLRQVVGSGSGRRRPRHGMQPVGRGSGRLARAGCSPFELAWRRPEAGSGAYGGSCRRTRA